MNRQAMVKHSLPDVKVLWRGKQYIGRVRGRLNDVATVYLAELPEISSEWSWRAVRRAVDSGNPLTLE